MTALDHDDPMADRKLPSARRHCQASRPAEETSVATYLQSRGIALALPPSIRFHVGLRHPSGSVWPAMVALVTSGADGTPLGVHRTFLGRDGNGKATVDP
jgi:hypothetical protein